jgi:B12-binding domain/radical SAM domain protein
MVRQVVRYRDMKSIIPFSNWREYPITAIFLCKGCNENCVICGGSAAAFRRCYGRAGPVYRSPEAVVRDAKQIARFSGGPVFLLGDLQKPDEAYAYEVLRRLGEARVKNQFILEFFNPAPTGLIREIGRVCPGFCLEMSAESHDPAVRRASGRHYSNEELERTIKDAFAAGCSRFDLFFMIGLPQQTQRSVAETIDYCEYLLQEYDGDKRLGLFIAPVSPFLDPGSLGFEEPERYGYKVLFRTLEEHRQALLSPSWKYSLNYETEWLSRDQIAEVAYDAILRLTRLKLKYGNIAPGLAQAGVNRIMAAREMMQRLDDLMAQGELEKEIFRLKPEIDQINAYPVIDKKQLELPVGWVKLRPWRALWALLTGR